MSLASCPAVSISALPGWSIFFAKEPGLGGDPNQSDMDKTVVLGPPGKRGPTPPTMKERILFLVLILIIVGAGGYLAVNPDVLMTLLGDAPGQPPPPQVAAPPVARPAPPAPVPAPAGSMPAPGAAPAAPAAAGGVAMPAPTAATITTPLFGEGQKVSVSAPTPLTADSAGKMPGPATAVPGSTLVVLDADLQNFAWIYSVRTEQGATGWVAENHLVAKK